MNIIFALVYHAAANSALCLKILLYCHFLSISLRPLSPKETPINKRIMPKKLNFDNINPTPVKLIIAPTIK
jgi:hypothetical protein